MSTEYRKLKYVRFYKDRVDVGAEGYNPKIILYYNSNDDLIKIREEWRGDVWEQTVSGTITGGSDMDQEIDYQTHFDPWEKI